jgi:hypothetical protein
MKLINLTPHAIVLQAADGMRTTIAPSGMVARVTSTPGQPEIIDGVPVPVYSPQTFAAVDGIPDVEDDTLYIVSALVIGRMAAGTPFVAPGTGPNDGAIRNDKGQIEAVTRLVRG